MPVPSKDDSRQYPIADVWKPTFHRIVEAFRSGDYALSQGVPFVEPLSASLAKQIREYIEDYGETLDILPEDAWATSVAQWVDRYWDVLVDLWTVESGASDLAISGRIFEDGDGYRIKVVGVLVP